MLTGHYQAGMSRCILTSDRNPSLLVEHCGSNLSLAAWEPTGRLNCPLNITIGSFSQLLNDSRPHDAAIQILTEKMISDEWGGNNKHTTIHPDRGLTGTFHKEPQ